MNSSVMPRRVNRNSDQIPIGTLSSKTGMQGISAATTPAVANRCDPSLFIARPPNSMTMPNGMLADKKRGLLGALRQLPEQLTAIHEFE